MPYAVIGVTYPEGSVCTCTNGTLTLTADDTSGKAMFVIPEAGTWTVKAVSGSRTASKAVSITAEGQVEAITITYSLMLYDAGNQYTDVTGGWDMYTYGGDVASNNGFHADHFTIRPNYPTRVSFATKQKIDLTKIKTLKLLARVYQEEGISARYEGGYFGVGSVQHPIANEWGTTEASNWAARVALAKADDYTELLLDVYALSGSYYVNVCGISGNSVQVFADVKSVIGEPV